MYNTLYISNELKKIEESLQRIIERTKHIKSANDFPSSASGMILLDAVCMQLIVIGEAVKTLDKHIEKALLTQYPYSLAKSDGNA